MRAQHIQRWKIPRSDFPMDRQGYLQWRTGLYKFHAETAGRLMREAGYDDEMIERVKTIVSKKGLKVNPETQIDGRRGRPGFHRALHDRLRQPASGVRRSKVDRDHQQDLAEDVCPRA